ncbi:MAG: type II secretion system protein GspN [Synergistaceae bacterium]|nr:type II secretion system protein GspN [Synergistaceae bacterium]
MKKVKTLLICFLVFLLGCVLFFPWNAVQSYAVTRIFRIAANNGVYVSAQNSPTEGLLDKKFVCSRVLADFPLLRFKTDRIAVNPAIFRTLCGKPSALVEIGSGSLTLITKQQLSWNSGVMQLSAEKDTVSLRDVNVSGEFSAEGFAEFSLGSGEIRRAQLALKVPAEVENALEMLSKGMVKGLEKTAPGNWRLVR